MGAENRESMEDILNPPETQVDETVAETQETATETKTETGAEKEQTQVAAEPKSEEKAEADPAAAVRAELDALKKERQRIREKEQALDAERQKLAEQGKEEKPFLGEEYEARFAEQEQAFQERLIQNKMEISEDIAREKYADYDEKLATFLELAAANPMLGQQARAAARPAEFAYKTAAEHLKLSKLKDIGDPEEYKEQLKAQLREELKAELLAEQEAAKKADMEAKIHAKLPKSGFSEERSTGPTRATTKKYDGPTPMKDILG